MPFTTAIWQICLLQVAAGAGNGGLMTLLMALSLTGVDSRGKTTAMGFFQGVYSVGMMLGPALMGALIENGGGYIAGYLAMAFIALASIVAVQFVRPCA
jgi:MFS family permease